MNTGEELLSWGLTGHMGDIAMRVCVVAEVFIRRYPFHFLEEDWGWYLKCIL